MPGRAFYRRRYATIVLVLVALAVFLIRITPLPGQVLGSTFFDRNGRIITTTTAAARIEVPLSEMSPYLPKAVVAVEDERFYRHFGVDPVGLLRALIRNIRARRIVEGGSTITQQLAKNMFLPPERTIGRKIREVILAFYLEVKFSKSEILERYLNIVYLGHGAYGVEMGARTFFGKNAKDLTLAESAMLAGLTRGPYYYSPYRDMNAAIARRALVLDKMADLGYITREEASRASREPIHLAGLEGREYRQAPYFVDHVMQEILRRYSDGGNLLYSGGLNIHTTLDLDMQLAAEEAFHEVLDAIPSKVAPGAARAPSPSVTAGPTRALSSPVAASPARAPSSLVTAGAAGAPSSSQSQVRQAQLTQPRVTQPQGALVAIDPRTGEVRALIGGRSFRETQFNRATDARRQPGSAFKPFVYAAALDSGYTAATPLTCEPIYLPVDSGVYSPKDFGKEPYHWRVLSVRDAIVVSCNVIAVKVNYEIGPQRGVAYARKMGIESPLGANLSLVLGTSEVTPLEMAVAFCPLANGGNRVRPLFVNSILDRHGRIIDSFRIEKRQVLDPRTAYILTDIMKGVLKPGGTAGEVSDIFKSPAAGKTGSSQNLTDAWFVGYTPELVTCIYIGYDDPSTPLGRPGGATSAVVWAKFMQKVYGSGGNPNSREGQDSRNSRDNPGDRRNRGDRGSLGPDFKEPPGLVRQEVCGTSGMLPTPFCPWTKTEIFKAETVPKTPCSWHSPGAVSTMERKRQ